MTSLNIPDADLGDGYACGKDGRVYEIIMDDTGKRLWINADDGSAVARFNTKSGVDIHNTASDQLNGAPECLWCTHGQPDYNTWLNFVAVVQEQFGLRLPINSINVQLLRANIESTI